MKNLTIMSYNYNVRCDTNRCSNTAAVSLGVKGESPGTFHNICNECLTALAHNVPLHMILERKDVQAHIAEQVQELLFTATEAGDTGPETPAEEPAEPTMLEQVQAMPWKDLRNLARDLEIEGYGQMKRADMEQQVAAAIESSGGDA